VKSPSSEVELCTTYYVSQPVDEIGSGAYLPSTFSMTFAINTARASVCCDIGPGRPVGDIMCSNIARNISKISSLLFPTSPR
jgi:hypothetical protein